VARSSGISSLSCSAIRLIVSSAIPMLPMTLINASD
jgi:hypothetical protein